MANKFNGIITPLITPIKNHKIDYNAVNSLIDFLKKSGIKGIFPTGSTGLFSFMTLEMHKKIIDAFGNKDIDLGKMLFMPGVGRNTINETLEIAEKAIKLNADFLVVVTPYYFKLDQEAIFNYFDKVLSKIEANVFLYNIPQFTGNSISYNTLNLLLKKHKNLVGIKDTSANFRYFKDLVYYFIDKINVLQGNDDLLLPSLMIGASGGVCGTTNFTNLAQKLFNAFSKNNIKSAISIHKKVEEIIKITNTITFPLSYNYLFYKFILNETNTDILEPFNKINKNQGNILAKKVKYVINSKI